MEPSQNPQPSQEATFKRSGSNTPLKPSDKLYKELVTKATTLLALKGCPVAS